MQVLTRKEAAGFLKIPIKTLDYLVSTGQIPFSRIGKRNVRFSKERLGAYFQSREGVAFRMPRKGKDDGENPQQV